MNDKTDKSDMRGHNLPPRDVHEGFLKKLLVNERDKQSQMAKNRAGLKRFTEDAEEIYKSARAKGVSVKALKHAFKVEKFLDRNVKNAAERLDVDTLDEAVAIMEQVEMFAPTALGVYPNDKAAAEGQKKKDADKLADAKAKDGAAFDELEEARKKKAAAKTAPGDKKAGK